jgi:hypothetical protein
MQRVARNAERSRREGKGHADRTGRILHSGRSHNDRTADRCTGKLGPNFMDLNFLARS